MIQQRTVTIYGCNHSTYDEHNRCTICGATAREITVYATE